MKRYNRLSDSVLLFIILVFFSATQAFSADKDAVANQLFQKPEPLGQATLRDQKAVKKEDLQPRKDLSIKTSVNRLQYRFLDNDDQWLFASSFNEFNNDLFLLGYYQLYFPEGSDRAEQASIYMGQPFSFKPLKDEYGWVTRMEWYEGFGTEYSAGLQVSPEKIYENRFKDSVLAKWILGTSTFIQILPLKTRQDVTGDFDINHRFFLPGLPKKWSIRGYNRFHYFENQSDIFQSNIDIARAMTKHIDLYGRWTWTNINDSIYGNNSRGTILSVGIRLNLVYFN